MLFHVYLSFLRFIPRIIFSLVDYLNPFEQNLIQNCWFLLFSDCTRVMPLFKVVHDLYVVFTCNFGTFSVKSSKILYLVRGLLFDTFMYFSPLYDSVKFVAAGVVMCCLNATLFTLQYPRKSHDHFIIIHASWLLAYGQVLLQVIFTSSMIEVASNSHLPLHHLRKAIPWFEP